MLRLLKWAYDLGVRNERHRIASYLANASSSRLDRVRLFDDELRAQPVMSKHDAAKRKIEERQKKAAVDSEVIHIIDGIFHAEEKYVRGASFMFPEGENK